MSYPFWYKHLQFHKLKEMPPKMGRQRVLKLQLVRAIKKWRKQKKKVRQAEEAVRLQRVVWAVDKEAVKARRDELLAEFPDTNLDGVMPQSDTSSSEED
jgi:hypothetical protein